MNERKTIFRLEDNFKLLYKYSIAEESVMILIEISVGLGT